MPTGQAESLMPQVEAALASAGLGWGQVAALGVGVGPGNFTGVRISVAAARGLRLALGIPAVGVSLFEALAFENAAMAQDDIPRLLTVQAMRGQSYGQLWYNGRALGAPLLLSETPADLAESSLPRMPQAVLGHNGAALGAALGIAGADAVPRAVAQSIAQCVAAQLSINAIAPDHRPAPLYVRPADAAPPRDAPVAILP